MAQAGRTKQREERCAPQLLTNEHSPAKYRVNGVVRNVDAWYKAFNVQPGDKCTCHRSNGFTSGPARKNGRCPARAAAVTATIHQLRRQRSPSLDPMMR